MAWETTTAAIVAALGAGGFGSFVSSLTTRRKIVSDARLSDGELSSKVNNMIANELERVVGQKERLEARYDECRSSCREANEKIDALSKEHTQCNEKLTHLQAQIEKLKSPELEE